MDYWLQELNKETSILDKIRNAYINNRNWKVQRMLYVSFEKQIVIIITFIFIIITCGGVRACKKWQLHVYILSFTLHTVANKLKWKERWQSWTCPILFSLEMLIQDVVRPYQMAAFESVCFSYPVRIERALRVSGSQLMACKEAPLAGTNKVCQS